MYKRFIIVLFIIAMIVLPSIIFSYLVNKINIHIIGSVIIGILLTAIFYGLLYVLDVSITMLINWIISGDKYKYDCLSGRFVNIFKEWIEVDEDETQEEY